MDHNDSLPEAVRSAQRSTLALLETARRRNERIVVEYLEVMKGDDLRYGLDQATVNQWSTGKMTAVQALTTEKERFIARAQIWSNHVMFIHVNASDVDCPVCDEHHAKCSQAFQGYIEARAELELIIVMESVR